MPLFMVRKEFYDAIMDGSKTSEWRAGSRWEYLYGNPYIAQQVAVIMSGPRRHRRIIKGVNIWDAHGTSERGIPRSALRIYSGERYFYQVVLGAMIGEATG